MAELLTQSADLYPIRTVSAITGINPVTLRAWERRYGLVRPHRTETGHRVYSARDIDKINRAVLLINKGHSISLVARMLERPGESGDANDVPGGNVWERYRDRMLTSICAFREEELDELLNESLALYSSIVVNRNLIVPVLTELGNRWQAGTGTVAEEHFFVFYLRNKLGARFHHHGHRNLGPLLVTACLPGEAHETGLLLFSLAALDRGYRLVNLGSNMPLNELPLVAKRSGAHGLVLSGRADPGKQFFEDELPAMVASSPVPVFVGGRISIDRNASIESGGATPLGDEIERALTRLDAWFHSQDVDEKPRQS